MAEIPLIYRSIQQTVGALPLSFPRAKKISHPEYEWYSQGVHNLVRVPKLAKGEEACTTLLLLLTGTKWPHFNNF